MNQNQVRILNDIIIINCFNNFWVGVVKNGCGSLGLENQKYALSQEWIDELR